MVPAHMMMLNSAFYFLAGFVIGVLVKSVIDGMASREVYEGRLDQLDRQYESIELDVEYHGGRLNRLESRNDDSLLTGQKPSPAEVADAVDMLVSQSNSLATAPPFGDYHRFLSRAAHNGRTLFPTDTVDADSVRI